MRFPLMFLLRTPVLLLSLATAALAQSRPAFYEISSPSTKVHLLGSIHMGKPSFYPLPAAVEKAWKESKAVAVEADVTDTSATLALSSLMVLMPPNSLDQELTPETWRKVQDHLRNPSVAEALKKAGIPPGMERMMRPWFLAVTISLLPYMEAGLDPALGIDMHFLKRARDEQRPILQVESLDFQARVLNGLPQEIQETMLLEALEGLASGETGKELAPLLEAWAKGDAKTMLDLAHKSTKTPEAKKWMRRLLEDRNPGMADKLAGYLAGKEPVFAILGAAHLEGPDGVLELLRKKGFKVVRIP